MSERQDANNNAGAIDLPIAVIGAGLAGLACAQALAAALMCLTKAAAPLAA